MRRSDAAGFVHQACVYHSEEELVAAAAPFLRDGLEAGEPTLLAMGGRSGAALRAALDDLDELVVLDDTAYQSPASTARTLRALVSDHAARGAPVRMVGAVPHPGTGAPWAGWAGYEAAINHLFADLPLRGLCVYDARVAPPEVLADVARVHPTLRTAAESARPSEVYCDPVAFVDERAHAARDPIEDRGPDLDLADPSPAEGRRAAGALGAAAGLDDDRSDGLVLAVSEAVANASVHGLPPVRVRAWTAPGRAVVHVTDAGSGPADPFVGLLPPNGDMTRGHGLWLVHQVCAEVCLRRGPDGFTVRLVTRADAAG